MRTNLCWMCCEDELNLLVHEGVSDLGWGDSVCHHLFDGPVCRSCGLFDLQRKGKVILHAQKYGSVVPVSLFSLLHVSLRTAVICTGCNAR